MYGTKAALFTEMICDGVCGEHIIVFLCVIGLVHSCVECRILLSKAILS